MYGCMYYVNMRLELYVCVYLNVLTYRYLRFPQPNWEGRRHKEEGIDGNTTDFHPRPADQGMPMLSKSVFNKITGSDIVVISRSSSDVSSTPYIQRASDVLIELKSLQNVRFFAVQKTTDTHTYINLNTHTYIHTYIYSLLQEQTIIC